jgi:hypothetical protein
MYSTPGEMNNGIVFITIYVKLNSMKKYSIIVALVMVFGISLSSCSAGAHVGTKHHQVSAGTQAH